jgi:hypothetical protein
MKGIIGLLLFIAAIVGLIFFQIESKKNQWNNLTTGGGEGVGVVTNKFKGISFYYSVNGVEYQKSSRTNPRGMVDGEKYTVYYDKRNPRNSVIDLTKPVIEEGIFVNDCSSILARVRTGENGLLKFQYNYHGKQYIRYHKVEYEDYSGKGPFLVKINRNQPSIAYMISQKCPPND